LDAPRLTAEFGFEINTRKPVVRCRVRAWASAAKVAGVRYHHTSPCPTSRGKAAFIPKAVAWRADREVEKGRESDSEVTVAVPHRLMQM
jgi:hypothetical protein